jgi:hypothetical protein
MQTLKVTLTGTRPLILGNPQTVDPLNPYAIESRRLNTEMKAARKKNDEDKIIEIAEKQRFNDFCSTAYFDDDGWYLPDTVLLATLKKGAEVLRKGKDIDRWVSIDEPAVRIIARHPDGSLRKKFRSLEEAYKDPAFRIEGPTKIPPKTGALVWKCRAMIPSNWTCTFTFSFDESITAKKLVEIIEKAGLVVGLCGWRPKFGRFELEIPDVKEDVT